MHLYSALLCIAIHPKRFTMWGGVSPQPPTSVQHPLGWCDGSHRTTAPVRSPHTSYRWEEREIEPIKLMGIIRRPWLTRASGGKLARTPGLHPTLYDSVMGFLMTTESGLGLTSHPKDGAFYSIVSRRYTGALGPTQTCEHPLLASLTPLPAAT